MQLDYSLCVQCGQMNCFFKINLLFTHMLLGNHSYKGHIKHFCFIRTYRSVEQRDKLPTYLRTIQLIQKHRNKNKERTQHFFAIWYLHTVDSWVNFITRVPLQFSIIEKYQYIFSSINVHMLLIYVKYYSSTIFLRALLTVHYSC